MVQKSGLTMSYIQSQSRIRQFTRKWTTPVLFVTSFVAVVGFPFLLNHYVHATLEDYATRVNGAQVTIRDFDLSFFRGTVNMQGVEITHHTQPMRNLVELDEVRMTLDRGALFTFKLIVPTLHIEGVHYGTARERSGELQVDEFSGTLPSTALLDRIAPGVYDSVRSSLGETPLRNLGQLTVGLAMRNSVAPHQQQLGIFQRIKSIDLELDHLLSEWDKENDRISHEAITKEERAIHFSLLRTKVRKDAANLSERAEKSFDATERDTNFILQKLGIPSLVDDDFTREILGLRTLNHLERIAYWIEVSRRKMGLDSQMGNVAAVRQAGAAVATQTDKPRLLVRKITIHSVAGTDRHKGDVQGEITDLASQPMGESHPLVIDLTAGFPNLQISGLKLHAQFNHSIAQPREVIDFHLDSYPLVDWAVEETPDLNLSVANGTMGLTFRSDFDGPNLSSKWTAQIRNATFEIESRFGLMERTLREVLTPLAFTIDVDGTLTSTNGRLEFDLKSGAGRQLATVFAERFRAPMQTARETIRDEIRERFMPQLKRLSTRIQNSTTHVDRRIADAIDMLGLRPG
jgi:uncharacterized protein (TIGR03545 family)